MPSINWKELNVAGETFSFVGLKYQNHQAVIEEAIAVAAVAVVDTVVAVIYAFVGLKVEHVDTVAAVVSPMIIVVVAAAVDMVVEMIVVDTVTEDMILEEVVEDEEEAMIFVTAINETGRARMGIHANSFMSKCAFCVRILMLVH